jgi:hypothetical protein
MTSETEAESKKLPIIPSQHGRSMRGKLGQEATKKRDIGPMIEW